MELNNKIYKQTMISVCNTITSAGRKEAESSQTSSGIYLRRIKSIFTGEETQIWKVGKVD